MKVTAKHKDVVYDFSSCASLIRWANDCNLFITNGVSKDLNNCTAKLVFIQKDSTRLEITKAK